MRHKEKCKWPEVVGSVSRSESGDMKGKGKVDTTLPRASKKKKHIKKLVAKVINSNVEIIARPSNVTRSRSDHVLLEHMDHLILVVENLTEAQWYTASVYVASGMMVGTLMDKCNFLRFKGVGLEEEDEDEKMDSVLKSGPRTGKRPATEPDHNRFGLDCSCGPGGCAIGLVAVAED